ncbi:Family of unknown function (DUF5765) [Plasmodiophora brassicae]
MCFSQGQSFFFAAVGFLIAAFLFRNGHTRLAKGVFYFFLMECLQGVQYFVIDECDNPVNKLLTVAGYLHICFQPFAVHWLKDFNNPEMQARSEGIRRICFLGGVVLFAKFLMYPWSTDEGIFAPGCVGGGTREWLRGSRQQGICTYRGVRHLAWSVPLYDSTYFSPGVGLHCFLMFAPYFSSGKAVHLLFGSFFFLSGPFLATCLTPNLQEQASIWCFFSIAQIAAMLVLIGPVLLRKAPTGDIAMSKTVKAA